MPEVLDGSLFGESSPCFGCAPGHPSGLQLSFERVGEGVRTHFTPREDQQGPPGVMHGGLVAALADECAAWAVIAALGRFGFTTTLQGRYSRPIRVGIAVEGRAWLSERGRRLVGVEVELRQSDAVAFTGSFRFALLDQEAAERMLGRSLPPAWERFARERR